MSGVLRIQYWECIQSIRIFQGSERSSLFLGYSEWQVLRLKESEEYVRNCLFP